VLEREKGISEKRAKNVAFIEHLDDAVGRVLESLVSTKLAENTLVIFVSDNGGALRYAQSNGPLRGGKQDMYEGGIRVPAIVKWTGRVKPGSACDRVAMHMDLFPTFCEVAGVIPGRDIDGISILPTLLGEEQDTGERTLFWVRREGNAYGGKAYYAARREGFKVLQNTPFEPLEYFNIVEDFQEKQSLNPSSSEEYARLRKEMEEHIRLSGQIPWQKRNIEQE
jgi:arylsulfatase A-like enzyme